MSVVDKYMNKILGYSYKTKEGITNTSIMIGILLVLARHIGLICLINSTFYSYMFINSNRKH